MDGQSEVPPPAALADRSRIQHQGVAASITPRPAGSRRPNGIYVNAMNSINDGDSSVVGNSVSPISGAGTGDNTFVSTVMRENKQMKEHLKLIMMSKRPHRSQGKNARKRHCSLSPEDLNNVFAIREYVRLKVFPYIKMKKTGWNAFSTSPKSICQRYVRRVCLKSWVTPEDYWIDEGTPAYSIAFSQGTSSYKELMRQQLQCEYYFVYQL